MMVKEARIHVLARADDVTLGQNPLMGAAALDVAHPAMGGAAQTTVDGPTWAEGLLQPEVANNFKLPTTRDEPWIYTNLRPLMAFSRYVAGAGIADSLDAYKPQLAKLLARVPSPRVVVVNGRWHPELNVGLDRLDGVQVTAVAREAITTATGPLPLAVLSAGFASEGIRICVDAGVSVDKPLWLVHILLPGNNGQASGDLTVGGSWLDVQLGKGSRLELVEHYMGPVSGDQTPERRGADTGPAGWLCDSRRIGVAAEAELRHTVLQTLPRNSFITSTDQVTVGDTADYRRDLLQAGAALARFEGDVDTGWAAFCRTNALQLTDTAWMGAAGSEQLHDVTVRINHRAAATRSEVTQRNVLAGTAGAAGHAVFQGKFYVAQAAQKTDAYMRCENLLLTDHGRASQKPELEIYADDVKCSHGASTGGLSAEQLFYLRARGLTETAARALLVHGFAAAALEQMPEAARVLAEQSVDTWLAAQV